MLKSGNALLNRGVDAEILKSNDQYEQRLLTNASNPLWYIVILMLYYFINHSFQIHINLWTVLEVYNCFSQLWEIGIITSEGYERIHTGMFWKQKMKCFKKIQTGKTYRNGQTERNCTQTQNRSFVGNYNQSTNVSDVLNSS